MGWVFALSTSASEEYLEMAKVAVLSAKRHTTLTPIAVLTGTHFDNNSSLISWLRCAGVRVIWHQPEWTDAVMKAQTIGTQRGYHKTRSPLYSDPYQMISTYLRLDFSILDIPDRFILYTDVDVLFTDDVGFADFGSSLPHYFTVGPEDRKEVTCWHCINMGVMLINRLSMQRTHEEMVQWVFSNDHVQEGLMFKEGPNDQGALRGFFRGRYTAVNNPLINWKPYWGFEANAKIVHFHGPKPADYGRHIKHGIANPLYAGLLNTCDQNPSCRLFLSLYEELNKESIHIAATCTG